jgi:hypothetical protein
MSCSIVKNGAVAPSLAKLSAGRKCNQPWALKKGVVLGWDTSFWKRDWALLRRNPFIGKSLRGFEE